MMNTHPATRIKQMVPEIASQFRIKALRRVINTNTYLTLLMLFELPYLAYVSKPELGHSPGKYFGSSCARNTFVEIKPAAFAMATV